MPTAAPRICARCGAVVPYRQLCGCRPAFAGSRHPGNHRRWKRCRIAKLKADPICEWAGCRLPAVEVDHIVALAAGGARWDPANWQSLCRAHHAHKTNLDGQHGRRRLR